MPLSPSRHAPRSEMPLPSFGWFAMPNLGDRIFKALCTLAASWVILLFFLLAAVLVWQSWPAITGNGLKFFTSKAWDPSDHVREFGSLAFVYGTLVTSAIAMAIAVPLGVGTATYLSEISTGWVRKIVSFLVE